MIDEYNKKFDKKIGKMSSGELDIRRKEWNQYYNNRALKELQRRGYLKKKIRQKSMFKTPSMADLMRM